MNKNQHILVVIAIVAVLGGGYWYFDSTNRENTDMSIDTSTSSTGTSTSGLPLDFDNVQVEYTGSVTGKFSPVDTSKLPPAPDTKRKVSYSKDLSPEVQKIYAEKIAASAADIKENPYSLEAWIGLGLNYKQAGDYAAARDAWEYASLLSPGNVVSFTNLGDLYHYYLKEYPKSEQNYRQAIKNDPTYVLSYVGLHELYRYSYGVLTTKAADILKEGIKANPKNIDLYTTLAAYYKSLNNKIDIANARAYYEKALAIAKELKNEQLIALIQAELDALK
jgi:tetratricopeptide (TPR) repeat protein